MDWSTDLTAGIDDEEMLGGDDPHFVEEVAHAEE